ncbi:MAG: MazG nucleotide pyrophosphohydrolase domain-containing protein [Pseudomonadota bacterium]
MARTLKEIQADSEKVSQIYARNCDIKRDDDWQVLKLSEEVGELTSVFLRMTSRGRLKGDEPAEVRQQFEDELADCLAQVLLIAERFEVDLEAAVERKWFRYLNNGAGDA